MLKERIEDKIIVPAYQIGKLFSILLPQVSQDPESVKLNGSKTYKVISEYYDTSDFQCYQSSYNGNPVRFKIRTRNYNYKGPTFLEIKAKLNQTVYKVRSEIDHDINEIYSELRISLLKINSEFKMLPISYSVFSKVSRIEYARNAFRLLKNKNIKITIDQNINYSFSKQRKSPGIPGLSILEFKHLPSDIFNPSELMGSLFRGSDSFSKYNSSIRELYKK